MFREPLRAAVGEVVERDGFYFADLLPGPAMVDAQQAAQQQHAADGAARRR
jgi:hypothetical protein